ncbi:unnamed protein product [Peronospora belbahrii]|uniref:2'-phosphotransferase n=1 Tax=Peronospora belbahrii TaxID=622444 RepID=A0AAU9L2F8_9STRA|nr:unnamed protein product [Peronospora belbahrii]
MMQKQRFTLTRNESGHGKLIRANQGHSMQLVQDDQLLIPLKMPISSRQCVHGTYLKFWDRIWNFGLSKMTRNHIHFAEKEVMDDQVLTMGSSFTSRAIMSC